MLLLPDLKLLLEFKKLLWQNVGFRQKVEVWLPKLLLHLAHIEAQPIFPCQLWCADEMIDLLVFVKILIDILLLMRWSTGPQQVPVILISMLKAMTLQDQTDELSFGLQDLKSECVWLIVGPRYMRKDLKLYIHIILVSLITYSVLRAELEPYQVFRTKPNIFRSTRAHSTVNLNALSRERLLVWSWPSCLSDLAASLENASAEIFVILILLMRMQDP